MCGLFGFYINNKELAPNAERLRVLALALANNNVTRGRDCFGIWTNSGNAYRKLGPVNKNFDHLHGALDELMAPEHLTEGFWLGGHTRQATHGTVSLENAHPFRCANIVLAHNGVVDVEGYDNKDHEVDSGRIAQAIVKDGWVAGLAKVSGSCALIVSVFLEDGPRLYLYRHSQTLNLAKTPWGWVWSSLKGHLEDSLAIAGITEVTLSEPKEDHLIAPWLNDFELHAPAKKRTYPVSTYGADSCGYQGRRSESLFDGEYSGSGGRYSGYRANDLKNEDSIKMSTLAYCYSREPLLQMKRWLVEACSKMIKYQYSKHENKTYDTKGQYCDFCLESYPQYQLSLENIGDDFVICCEKLKCKKDCNDARGLYDSYLKGSVKQLPASLEKLFRLSNVYDGIYNKLVTALAGNDKKVRKSLFRRSEAIVANIREVVQEAYVLSYHGMEWETKTFDNLINDCADENIENVFTGKKRVVPLNTKGGKTVDVSSEDDNTVIVNGEIVSPKQEEKTPESEGANA